MTSLSDSMDREAPAQPEYAVWNTRELFARHKALGIGSVVLLVILLVIIIGGLASSTPVHVTDASTCSAWSSANQTGQQAYAETYVREHGSVRGSKAPANVIAAINNGCGQAFDNDVQDNITVVQAIQQQ
jgi:hypothetical protein